MTPRTYWLGWIGLAATACVALYWIVRWAVAAGISDAGR